MARASPAAGCSPGTARADSTASAHRRTPVVLRSRGKASPAPTTTRCHLQCPRRGILRSVLRRTAEGGGRPVRRCQRDRRGLRPAGAPAHGPQQTVVLLGIDGSGKTTTATALAAAAREAGRPAIVLRNRSGRRWLARASARCGLEVPVRWADRFETSVRNLNVLVSQARARRRKGLVVIDRHLVCQLVLRQGRGLPPGRWLPWAACRALRPHTVVVLDVPAETAQQRILRRGVDHESLNYLRTARTAYLELASVWGGVSWARPPPPKCWSTGSWTPLTCDRQQGQPPRRPQPGPRRGALRPSPGTSRCAVHADEKSITLHNICYRTLLTGTTLQLRLFIGHVRRPIHPWDRVDGVRP